MNRLENLKNAAEAARTDEVQQANPELLNPASPDYGRYAAEISAQIIERT